MSRLPRIVMMEDNPADVLLMREALREQGLEVDLLVVPDGEAALAWVGANASADLILLDLNLPRHDGIEVLERIRGTLSLRDVPVAVVSSSDSPHDRAGAERLGADRFIAKPCTLDEFLLIGVEIKSLLAQRTRPADTKWKGKRVQPAGGSGPNSPS
jgi:two-component system, chemotaxis family, response regulator Rcp1